MQLKQIRNILTAEPFEPLQLTKRDGRSVAIPFRHVAVPVRHGLIVFKGVKSATSHSAKTFELIPFDGIVEIKPKSKKRSSKKV